MDDRATSCINFVAQLRECTQLWIKLQHIHLSDVDDQIAWKLNASSEYNSATTSRAQFFGLFSGINYSKLWKSKVQLKCNFFMWLWLRQRILMDDMLQLRGIDHEKCCTLCGTGDGRTSHH
jgi:hypothetical protein